jgi:signal peptidase II
MSARRPHVIRPDSGTNRGIIDSAAIRQNRSVPETRSVRRMIATTAATVIALDAVTKALAVHFLTAQGTVAVPGGVLRLELYRNFAGPRNTFQGHPVLVSVMAMAGIAAIALLAGRVQTTSAAIAVGLLLGGGLGNLLDRLLRAPGPLRGGVIDWLKPAWSSGSMNLADLSITAAVLVLAGSAALSWWRTRRTPIAPTA